MDVSVLAHQVLDVCIGLKPGERIWINSWDHTLELATGLAWECEKRKCPVVLTVQPESLWLQMLIEAPLEIVDGLPAHQAELLEKTDAYIYTLGPRSPIPWNRIPEERRKLATVWFLEKNRFVEQWKTIAKRRRIRMVGIEATLATSERAKVLGLDADQWMSVMLDGCMVDYREVTRRVSALVPLLSGRGAVHITTPHGTDFRFRLDTRPPDFFGGIPTPEMVEQGRVAFLPAGGIEVSADETSGKGTVVYDAPIRTWEGIVEQLSIEVEKGRITRASAKTGQEIFQGYLGGDGDVDKLAFFGLGLNPGLVHGYTQDDKVLGGVTIGFGDNQEKSGHNKASGKTPRPSNWWASMREGTVTIDSKLVMDRGRLLV